MFCFSINEIMAQPNPPNDHGQGGNEPPGGGAPIAGGISILITLGAAYGARKWYQSGNEEQE